MFASSGDVDDIKQLVKSLSHSVEDLTTEVKLMRRELDEMKR